MTHSCINKIVWCLVFKYYFTCQVFQGAFYTPHWIKHGSDVSMQVFNSFHIIKRWVVVGRSTWLCRYRETLKIGNVSKLKKRTSKMLFVWWTRQNNLITIITSRDIVHLWFSLTHLEIVFGRKNVCLVVYCVVI